MGNFAPKQEVKNLHHFDIVDMNNKAIGKIEISETFKLSESYPEPKRDSKGRELPSPPPPAGRSLVMKSQGIYIDAISPDPNNPDLKLLEIKSHLDMNKGVKSATGTIDFNRKDFKDTFIKFIEAEYKFKIK